MKLKSYERRNNKNYGSEVEWHGMHSGHFAAHSNSTEAARWNRKSTSLTFFTVESDVKLIRD